MPIQYFILLYTTVSIPFLGATDNFGYLVMCRATGLQGLFVMWRARSHSSHSVTDVKTMAQFVSLSEREIKKYVDDKDFYNTKM